MDEKEKEQETERFGWKPEIAGAIGVMLLIWYLIAFARGSL